jgi:hypothetical protein
VGVTGISISGLDAGNYHLVNATATTTADITARGLTVSAHGVNKTYDGTTAATVTLSDDRVSGDTLTDNYTSASFGDKNVGAAKPVGVSGISISGSDAGNYHQLNTTATATADIAARGLTVSAHGINKTYDGTAAATVTLSDNGVPGDAVSDSYTTALFADKNVAIGKNVTVSGISISGADAGNYKLMSTTASTTANITARGLTVSAHGVNKVYDGATTATVTLTDDRVAGDSVSDSYAIASFADKHVGIAKPVSVNGIAISGTDAGNYILSNTTATTTASITARPVAVSADNKTKFLGAADPPLTFTVTSGSLAAGDSWTGTLVRDAGEAIGSYAIRQGTLNVNDGNAGQDYTIAFTVGALYVVYVTSGTCNGDAGHAVLQPVNGDGTSVFKQGSTVPVKFRVCDVNGNSIGPNPDGSSIVKSFALTNTTSGAGVTNEQPVSTTPDTAFRWDATNKQWIFNLSTKNLVSAYTYTYTITLQDGSTICFKFGLK